LQRAHHALASRRAPQPLDRRAARTELEVMMKKVGTTGA
jgi:hypothetical protein